MFYHSKIKENKFYFFFLLITFIGYLFFNLIVLNDPILVQHGFRQTHNALVSYYFIKDGFSLAYEIPTWGEPWSVPHEFPIYHWVVAKLSYIFNLPLTLTGRLVSLINGLLISIPIFCILKKLKINKEAIYLSLILVFSAPVFIYWSGTFMIETSALLYSLCFIFFVLKIIQGNRELLTFIFFSFFLTLSLLQKITTAFPLFLVITFMLLIYLLKNKRFIYEYKFTINIAIAIIIPCFIFLAWFLFSENVKSQNPAMGGLTFENSINWYFGTIKDKLSGQLWLGTIFESTIIPSSGIFLGFFSFLFLLSKSKNKELKIIMIIMLALFLFPFLIHTRVHINHKYYQVANFVYWSIISGISIHFLFREYLKFSISKFLFLIAILLITNYLFFFHKYFFHYKSQIQEHDKRTIFLGEYLKANTDIDRPLIIFGYGSSSTLTFYSERKALSIGSESQGIDAIINYKKYLSQSPSAFVLCPYRDSKGKEIKTYDKNKIKELIHKNFKNYTKEEIFLDCEIIFN